ncbi:type III secretion system inner rod subunit SctI [Enterobacteriaceae bacterium H20N1]|uniref:Type III secretion system inner rod subunit SctI n=1 Tax=Dryocola boscaweniae TaxID=2925397 RepID=A0A9X3AB54_9ENTR|nr:type III secretion system inner rod subunit SctI [Dryocola boscaweniae]MCT4700518.1 type III secretion system inner rod subunit SctI [Dryocola boscaweniae]MCT4717674.1 type III secretion system inner rod subunit SctI [Dryocola boscaweniae]
MTVSAIQAIQLSGSNVDGTFSQGKVASAQDIEMFTQRLLAGSASSPEQNALTQIQQAQKSLMSGIRDVPSATQMNPEQALATQTRLAGSVIGVDMVAKVAGSFSQAVNKLVTMQ